MKTRMSRRPMSAEERHSDTNAPATQRQTTAAPMPDARAASLAQLQHQERAGNSSQAAQLKARAEMMAGGSNEATVQRVEDDELLQGKFAVAQREEDELLQGKFAPVQRMEDEELLQGKFAGQPVAQLEAMPNKTGMPDQLKAGIETLSGMSMDHVKVHYNSSAPAQLNAHAFAQGSDIHVAPGQEQHLPHEAWHVVQQAQGRVSQTKTMDGVGINDDAALESEADRIGAQAVQLPPHRSPSAANASSADALSDAVGTAQRVSKSGESILQAKKLATQTDTDMMGLTAAQLAGNHGVQNRAGEERARDVVARRVAESDRPARPLQRKVALLTNGIRGVADSVPVQRVLNRLPQQVNGPLGLKDVYVDTDDNVHYRRAVGGAGTQINLVEVTIEATGRYAAVAHAAPRLMDTATGLWVAAAAAPAAAVGGAGGAGAPAAAVAAGPVVAPGPAPAPPQAWTTQQGTAAGFTRRAGAHYQRDSPDFNGYHVHASFYHQAQRFTDFHIKFDTGADHVSLFYQFGAGAAYHHYGQTLQVRRAIVQAFSHPNEVQGVATTAMVDGTLATMEAHANVIAAAIIALL